MRLNRFVAQATGISRRQADELIASGQITINGETATVGIPVNVQDVVEYRGRQLSLPATKTIIFNKPVGYVVSRKGQGSPTIYDLLPADLKDLKPVGRLDKDSSGLLLLTNDGALAQELSHPSRGKLKRYEVTLGKPLRPREVAQLGQGVLLDDGISKFKLERAENDIYLVSLSEGRNRQIRRTFAALGHNVKKLHRTGFGPYKLGLLEMGDWRIMENNGGRTGSFD